MVQPILENNTVRCSKGDYWSVSSKDTNDLLPILLVEFECLFLNMYIIFLYQKYINIVLTAYCDGRTVVEELHCIAFFVRRYELES